MVPTDTNAVLLPHTPATGRSRKELETRTVVHGINERQPAEHTRTWLALLVDSCSDAIIGKTLDGVIVSWNNAAQHLYGYTAAEMLGCPLSLLFVGDSVNGVPYLMKRISANEHIEHYETVHTCSDGRRINVSLTISPIKDKTGTIIGASTIARDITERKRADEQIRHLALHDALTGLPNRILFRERVTDAIRQARRAQQQVAVLFIDLDHFKGINDTLGHQIGDRLLQLTASRLRHCLREGDGVARLGGDEFVVDLPVLIGSSEAMAIARKILEVLREPFMIDQYVLHASASIGIGLYPNDGQDVETLMHAADTAMYHAKKKGRDNYQFFQQAYRRAPATSHCPRITTKNHEQINFNMMDSTGK